MNEALDNDTGYVRHRTPPCDPANITLILAIHIHVPGEGEDVPYGNHSRITKKHGPPDIVGVLEKEFRDRAGKVIVSRKRIFLASTDMLTSKFARPPISATLPVCTCSEEWRSVSTSSS